MPPLLAYKRVGAVMAVCILAIGVAILNGFYPSSNTRINGIYATAIGEMHLQILADSSVMEINTDSQVQVDTAMSCAKSGCCEAKHTLS